MHRSDRREPQVNPARRRAATARLIRRVGEAIDLLAPAGIVVTPLDPEQATAVLAAACNPDTALARSDRHTSGADVVTAAMSQASVAESPTHFDADSLAQFDEPVNDIRAELDVRDHLEDDFDLDGDLVDDLDDLDDHDLSDHHHDRRRRATLGRSRR
jgi:hypothetical protein